MRVLLLGSGGREHALAWKISKSEVLDALFIAPGNGGMESLGECLDIDMMNHLQVVKTCNDYSIDLVVVGPEAPLVSGLVDTLHQYGIKAFGPDQYNSQFEGSKAFSKAFMQSVGIPTSKYVEVNSFNDGIVALANFEYPCVIKADGLAAGKGVIIADDETMAIDALKDMMIQRQFKDAGDKVVIEDYVRGVEASVFVLIDGDNYRILEGAQDYKRALDGGNGLNTGGMGSFSPNPVLTKTMIEKVESDVVIPFVKGTKSSGHPYKGVLFIGLMINDDDINVLEFNVRFGDPETQSILPRLENDLLALMLACEEGTLDDHQITFSDKVACTIMATSGGYPLSYDKGFVISGVDVINNDVICFHSGTKKMDAQLVTNGGRVLSVTLLEDSLELARHKAYEAMKKISFDGITYRSDIGNKILR